MGAKGFEIEPVLRLAKMLQGDSF